MNIKSALTYFKTTDLALSAALVVLGYKIDKIEPISATQGRFVFTEDHDLLQYVEDFKTDRLMVPAKAFMYAIREIKQEIREIQA